MAKSKGMARARLLKGKKKATKQTVEDALTRDSMEHLASLMDRWCLWMEQMNYKERSIDTKRRQLVYFIKWCEQRSLMKAEEITKPILESYQRTLFLHRSQKGKPLSVGSQRNRIGAIRGFFSYLCKKNYIVANPASELDLPRQPARLLPRGLSEEELKKLFNVPDVTDPLGVRDRALLEVFYATGIRRTELSRLELADIDFSRQTLHVIRGKGDKSRLVPIGARALYWVRRYVEESREMLLVNQSTQALFISGYGDAFSPSSLGNLMKKMLNQAGIEKEGSCHLLRHTCATHMLEKGADIRLIQQLLGHAKLDTTSIYTQVAITHLQEVYKRTHPSAQTKK